MLMDKPALRSLLKYMNPRLKETDIPQRMKIREEVLRRASISVAQLGKELKVHFYFAFAIL